MEKKKYSVISALIIFLLGAIRVKAAQMQIPAGLADWANMLTMGLIFFVLFYAIVMIIVGWVYMHKRNRPLEVIPFEPKTLGIMGGITGLMLAFTPTGIIPEEFIFPFMALVGVSLAVLVVAVAMDVTAIRSKEKETSEEAAADIVASGGTRVTRQEAALIGKEEAEELEEQDTLKHIIIFLHSHPTTRHTLETIFQEHQDELKKKFGRDVIFVDEMHKLYNDSRSTFVQEQGMTELEAADILIARGEALIEAEKDDAELQQLLRTRLTHLKKMTREIIDAVKKGTLMKEKEKETEHHILEYICAYVRHAILEIERDIGTLRKNPRADPDYKNELSEKAEILKELSEFDKLLMKLTEEIAAEAHYLAEDAVLTGKMRRVNRAVYGNVLSSERARELKEQSKLRIE